MPKRKGRQESGKKAHTSTLREVKYTVHDYLNGNSISNYGDVVELSLCRVRS